MQSRGPVLFLACLALGLLAGVALSEPSQNPMAPIPPNADQGTAGYGEHPFDDHVDVKIKPCRSGPGVGDASRSRKICVSGYIVKGHGGIRYSVPETCKSVPCLEPSGIGMTVDIDVPATCYTQGPNGPVASGTANFRFSYFYATVGTSTLVAVSSSVTVKLTAVDNVPVTPIATDYKYEGFSKE